jgi:hypothetical protein
VDGQQRITSLTLLLCAIRDRLVTLSPDVEAATSTFHDYTSQLLLNSNLKPEFQARLVPQSHDRSSLDAIVAGAWGGNAETRVERAYQYFTTKLAALDSPALTDLLTTILTRLSAVWVTLDHDDNSHRVFQTLNAGGKKLRQSDLVRNYFFLLLGAQGDEFYAGKWRGMEDELDDREIENYFVAWAISQGHSGSQGSLFSYFQSDLRVHEGSASDVLAYGERLVATSQLFRAMRRPEDSLYSGAIKRTLTDLRNWSTVPAEGLLLWLLRQEADGLMNEIELGESLEIVMSFLARRQLAGYEPNLHKSILATAARKLRASGLSRRDAVEYLRFVLSEGDELRTWPSDDEIRADIKMVSLYSRSRSAWTFSILERIDRGMYAQEKNAPTHIERGKYSVEHILPQTLTQAWIEDLQDWGEDSPHRLHESRLHSLGNLTLTPINSELGNRRLAEKKSELADDSLRLNHFFKDANSWTSARIDERSIALAKIACSQYVSPWRDGDLEAARTRFARIDARVVSVDEDEVDAE